MNKEYAMQILECVEANTLESDISLVREAFNYLKKLKKISNAIIDRIYRIEYGK